MALIVIAAAAAAGSLFGVLALLKCCTHCKAKSSTEKGTGHESPNIVAYHEEKITVKSPSLSDEKLSNNGGSKDDLSDFSKEQDKRSTTSSSDSWFNNVSDFDADYFEDDMNSGPEDTVEDNSFIFVATTNNEDPDDFESCLPIINEEEE